MKITYKNRLRFVVLPKYLLLLLALLAFTHAFGQSARNINGVITDSETNETLAGVSVKNKNTNATTICNAEGKYTIKAKQGDILIFTLIGYEMAQQQVGKDLKMDVKLKPDVSLLKQVVVIGYGEVAKEDLTGSVGQVNLTDLTRAPVANFEQALAGRIAGVQVTSNDDQPGGAMNIVIRGAGSLSQSTAPLYVIDGFPIEDFDASNLNMNDIESINILKDASATAIYGARGANGVVVVETKKGKEGLPTISYGGDYGIYKAANRMEMMSVYDFVKYQIELNPVPNAPLYFPDIQDPSTAAIEQPTAQDLERYRGVKGMDWQDKVFRTGITGNHTLSLRGGTAQTKYMVSGSYFTQEGTIVNSGMQRYQGRISLDQNVSKKLTTGVNLNYNRTFSYGVVAAAEGEATSALLFTVWGYRPIIGSLTDDDYDLEGMLLDPEIISGRGSADSRVNPVINNENSVRQRRNTTVLANVYANYNFTKNLYLRVQGAMNSAMLENEYFYNSKTSQGKPLATNVKGVQGGESYLKNNTFSNENTLNYKATFNKKHQLNAVLGFSSQLTNSSSYGFAVQNLPMEELGLAGLKQGKPNEVKSTAYDVTMASFFGRAIYNFNSKYLFTATFRADGSSKFAKDNRWGYFPSGAFAWRMNKEPFMKNMKFVDEAKLRVSYGVTGNNRVGPYDYSPQIDIGVGNGYSYNNAETTFGTTLKNIGNENLKWETTAQLDLGYDLTMFKKRVDLTVDVYQKTVNDLLLKASIPWVTGYATAYKNIGKLRNQGLEISLNTVNIASRKFKWESNFNISFNDNKVLGLANNEEFLLSSVSWQSTFNTAYPYIASVGGPSSAFFGVIWDGVYQYSDFDLLPDGKYRLKSSVADNGNIRDNIRPGDIKYRDINGDGTVDSKDATVIGRTLPIHTGGFSNNFNYKGFSLNVFFQWSYGNDILNANKAYFIGNQMSRYNLNQFAIYADRWTPENSSSNIFRTAGGGPGGVYSSWLIEDGSFLRLKTVSLSYNLPQKLISKIKLKTLAVSAAAQNLYTWTNYPGMDPEVSVRNSVLTPGLDWSAYPRQRTIVFGIRTTL